MEKNRAEEYKRQELQKLKEKRKYYAVGLPHLYGWKWYEWAKDFFDSRNRINLLCAANQISKSSTQIRKCIHWATESSLWPELWAIRPRLFWYLYPTQKQIEIEFLTKWSQFLPAGEFKDHPKFGWREERVRGDLSAIHFNSGVSVFFKTYMQNLASLQSATVDAIFADEELPVDLYDELMFRLTATNGYFHMVFTATLGQDFWRRAMEPTSHEEEVLPQAWKRVVSAYDCMEYTDGTKSFWTEERIAELKSRCKSHQEVLKRIYGKFIVTSGRKYPAFDAQRHMKAQGPIPEGWMIYVGADPGSGGENGHPAALCYVAVRPDLREGIVVAGWRGDGIATDNSYIVKEHKEFKERYGFKPILQCYDWASKDFHIVAGGMEETFIPAEKSHEKGEDIINTLFNNDMLSIYETAELSKLAGELSTLKQGAIKRHAKDDFSDALRYAVTKVPWDFSQIGKIQKVVETAEEKMTPIQREIAERRKQMDGDGREEGWPDPEEEFEEWNELAGG